MPTGRPLQALLLATNRRCEFRRWGLLGSMKLSPAQGVICPTLELLSARECPQIIPFLRGKTLFMFHPPHVSQAFWNILNWAHPEHLAHNLYRGQGLSLLNLHVWRVECVP